MDPSQSLGLRKSDTCCWKAEEDRLHLSGSQLLHGSALHRNPHRNLTQLHKASANYPHLVDEETGLARPSNLPKTTQLSPKWSWD